MPVPVLAVLEILGVVVSSGVVHVLHDQVENMTDDRGACERRVVRACEYFV